MIPHRQQLGIWARRVPLPFVVAVAITATGCAPLVGVKHLSTRNANHAMTSNVLSTNDLSAPTRIALRRHNLLDQFDDNPAGAIAQLHRAVVSEGVPNDDLFALAELSFFYAEKSRQTQYYLAAVVYAFAYLFPEDPALRPVAMDPRYRLACDLYERSLTLGFKTAKDGTVELRASRYALPFGALDVAFDEANLQWGNRQLKDFVPASDLEVIGLRNRYETHGIGAPLAAATARTDASQSGDDLVGPFVRVPVTAVLVLDHPRQQLTGTEIHGTLRLIAANTAETITIGTETVPLEIDRTAPLAASLAASSMLENELGNFLGTVTGVRGQSFLGARAPFQPGRIPVVFVHGTNSSPARWADMVNDLEADPWVRQHYQFWFFKYDSGNPIAYSAMLLRRALRKAVHTYDPQGQDPCLQHMIVIGHSQGGLLTKMTVIDSGDRFWRNVSDTPLDQLQVSDDTRALLREAMFVKPLPFVSRVVFIATPHRGSYLAGPQVVRRLVQKLVSMPSTLLRTGADLLSKGDVKPYLKIAGGPDRHRQHGSRPPLHSDHRGDSRGPRRSRALDHRRRRRRPEGPWWRRCGQVRQRPHRRRRVGAHHQLAALVSVQSRHHRRSAPDFVLAYRRCLLRSSSTRQRRAPMSRTLAKGRNDAVCSINPELARRTLEGTESAINRVARGLRPASFLWPAPVGRCKLPRSTRLLGGQRMDPKIVDTTEQKRLNEAREAGIPWKKWGPYLSERQWGTVREDYSENGDAWNFFTHDHARSRAYRWGEDGIAGISDDKQHLCFALALWNGKDPILKERLFGLTNSEGNHGEDVKEYYFYLDSTPTHSYMKYLYKYPQAAYPYADLVETNRRRTRNEMEYELLDTGVFNDDRYFDVFVEYAKAGPEDILVRITAANRGPDAAELHLLPTLWFRNDWASWIAESNRAAEKPNLRQIEAAAGTSAVAATHPLLGEFVLSCEGEVPLLFTENETNHERLFPGQKNESPYVKDGINDCVVQGNRAR